MDRIVIAALGGFAGWCLIQVITYFVRRNRYEAYLMVHFRIIAENQTTNRKWLDAFVDKVLREGKPIKGAPFYTQEDFGAIDAALTQVIGILDSYDLTRVTYFAILQKEIEILFAGFCRVLLEYQERKTALKENEVVSLLLRYDRIINYVNILPDSLRDFSDLPTPETIKQRQGAETLVLQADSSSVADDDRHSE
jgi:hypothetical protein